MKNDVKLNLKAANGISMSYIGYIEADIECMGNIIKTRGTLIIKDTVDKVTRKRKKDAPGILGTKCRDIVFQQHGNHYHEKIPEIFCNSKVISTFRLCDQANRPTYGFAKTLCTTSHSNSRKD